MTSPTVSIGMLDYKRNVQTIAELIETEVNDLFSSCKRLDMQFDRWTGQDTINPHFPAVKSWLRTHIDKVTASNLKLMTELDKLCECVNHSFITKLSSENELVSTNSKLMAVSESLKGFELLIKDNSKELEAARCDERAQESIFDGDSADVLDVQQTILKEIQKFNKKTSCTIRAEVSAKLMGNSQLSMDQVKTRTARIQTLVSETTQRLDTMDSARLEDAENIRNETDDIAKQKHEELMNAIKILQEGFDAIETQVNELKDATEASHTKVEDAISTNPQNVQRLINDLHKQKRKVLLLQQELNTSGISEMIIQLPKDTEALNKDSKICSEELKSLINGAKLEIDGTAIKEAVAQAAKNLLIPMEIRLDVLQAKYFEDTENLQTQGKDLSKTYNSVKTAITTTESSTKKLVLNYAKLDELIREKFESLSGCQNTKEIDEQIKMLCRIQQQGARAYEKAKEATENAICEVEKKVFQSQQKVLTLADDLNQQVIFIEGIEKSIETTYTRLVGEIQNQSEIEEKTGQQADDLFAKFSTEVQKFENQVRDRGKLALDEATKKYVNMMYNEMGRFDEKQRKLEHFSESLATQITGINAPSLESYFSNQNLENYTQKAIVETWLDVMHEKVIKEVDDFALEQRQAADRMQTMCDEFEFDVRSSMAKDTGALMETYLDTFKQIEFQCVTTLSQVSELVKKGNQLGTEVENHLDVLKENEQYYIEQDGGDNTKKRNDCACSSPLATKLSIPNETDNLRASIKDLDQQFQKFDGICEIMLSNQESLGESLQLLDETMSMINNAANSQEKKNARLRKSELGTHMRQVSRTKELNNSDQNAINTLMDHFGKLFLGSTEAVSQDNKKDSLTPIAEQIPAQDLIKDDSWSANKLSSLRPPVDQDEGFEVFLEMEEKILINEKSGNTDSGKSSKKSDYEYFDALRQPEATKNPPEILSEAGDKNTGVQVELEVTSTP